MKAEQLPVLPAGDATYKGGFEKVGRCGICKERSKVIAAKLGACRSCILEKPDQALPEGPRKPYSLLAFHPCFHMSDLALTPRRVAEECLAAAQEEGLRWVRLGNVHLLA
jgi:hypothetical protein